MNFFQNIPLLLINAFKKLGRLAAKHPRKIIIISLVSSIFMSVGIFKVQIEKDVVYLNAPINCRGYEEERIINQLFPVNISTNFDIYRQTNLGLHTSVTMVPISEGSVLKKSIFNEASALDQMIRSFKIEWEGYTYNYSDVCAKQNGECFNNDVLSYINKIEQRNEVSIKYPVDIDIFNMRFNVTALGFGGVTVGNMKDIVDAKALRLLYFLDNGDKVKEDVALKWEQEFFVRVSKQKSTEIRFIKFSTTYFSEEYWNVAIGALKYGFISSMLLITVCVLSSMTSDWTTSKPLLSVAGCVSVGMAIVASFAMIAAIGIPFAAMSMLMPFLIAGIGVDDMFILIAAWRKTDAKDNVINRMENAYSYAAMSITMTSLTNLISFLVGATIPIPVIRNFCIQSAFAITFDLIYQLTFFGGCMALDGYREEKKLHPITFKPIVLAKDAADRSWIYRKLFTNSSEISELNPPRLMIWFRDALGHWINQTWVKILILVAFAIYLAGASWGITTLKEGIELQDFFSHDSEAYTYIQTYFRYFSNYSESIQVAINANLDYSNRTVQKHILRIVNRIHKNKYISPMSLNWLKHYLLFIKLNNRYISSYNLTDPREFNRCLRDVFFQHPMGKIYKNDIVFDNNGIYISASRFIFFTEHASELEKEKERLIAMRLIADSLPYSVTFQSVKWLFYEIFLTIRQITVQSIAAAITATFLVFFLFTQHFLNVASVTISVISVEFGVFGYMAALGIHLNFFTGLMLILSVGLCVDSSAHILYAYFVAKGTCQGRIQQALYSAGMPILQGVITSLISVTPLAIVPNALFRMAVVLAYLQLTIALFHALFVLPTLLSLWEITLKSIRKGRSKVMSENAMVSSSVSVIDASHL